MHRTQYVNRYGTEPGSLHVVSYPHNYWPGVGAGERDKVETEPSAPV